MPRLFLERLPNKGAGYIPWKDGIIDLKTSWAARIMPLFTLSRAEPLTASLFCQPEE